jgi:hypothetical protein
MSRRAIIRCALPSPIDRTKYLLMRAGHSPGSSRTARDRRGPSLVEEVYRDPRGAVKKRGLCAMQQGHVLSLLPAERTQHTHHEGWRGAATHSTPTRR